MSYFKGEEYFLPNVSMYEIRKVVKLSTPQWVDALFVAKWVSIK